MTNRCYQALSRMPRLSCISENPPITFPASIFYTFTLLLLLLLLPILLGFCLPLYLHLRFNVLFIDYVRVTNRFYDYDKIVYDYLSGNHSR